MANDVNDRRHEATAHHTVQRLPTPATDGQQDAVAPGNSLARTPLSLLGDPRLNGRGNGVVRQALVQRTQQSIGNQATRRILQRQATGRSAVAGGPVAVQRYDSFEHVHLGDKSGGAQTGLLTLECHRRDLPQRAGPVTTWPPNWQQFWGQANSDQKRAMTKGLTYGEVVALSGDFYENYAALNRAPLREVIDLVPLVRRIASTTELQNATGGRYLEMAEQNEHHFSNTRPGQSNMDTWRTMHGEAIQAAMRGDANTAWGMNASADHYLTDAFAAGHIRTPRSELMGSKTGNFQSKVLHDLDNENGVEVSNRRGDKPWVAYGDDKMGESTDEQKNPNARNLQMVEEAVRRSKQDIVDALAQGARYKMPSPYAVEELIPKAVDPTKDRWTGRTPTYTAGPDGPIRNADDYTMKRDQVIVDEGPGVIAGLFTDDDAVRDWVARQDAPAIGRQSAADKSRMINTLLSGYITEGDVAAIERIAGTVPDDAEMAAIREQVKGGVNNMTSPFQWRRVTVALKMNQQSGGNTPTAQPGAGGTSSSPSTTDGGSGGGRPGGVVGGSGTTTGGAVTSDGGTTGGVPTGAQESLDGGTPVVAEGTGGQRGGVGTDQQGEPVESAKLQALATVDARDTAVARPYTFTLISGLKRDTKYQPGQTAVLALVIHLDGTNYYVAGLPIVIDKYDADALRVEGHIKGNWRIAAADLTLSEGKAIHYAWSK